MEIREIFSTPRGWLIIDEEEARWQGAVDFFFPSSFSEPNTPGKFIVWFRNETTLLVLWQPPYPAGIYTHYKVSIDPADAIESVLYVEKEGEPPGPAQAAFKGLVPGKLFLPKSFYHNVSLGLYLISTFRKSLPSSSSLFLISTSRVSFVSRRQGLQYFGSNGVRGRDLDPDHGSVSNGTVAAPQRHLRQALDNVHLVPRLLEPARGNVRIRQVSDIVGGQQKAGPRHQEQGRREQMGVQGLGARENLSGRGEDRLGQGYQLAGKRRRYFEWVD